MGVSVFIGGQLADAVRQQGTWSITSIRKIFTCTGEFLKRRNGKFEFGKFSQTKFKLISSDQRELQFSLGI